MTITDPKTTLHRYLQTAREVAVWKLDGLSEYDARRPLVPSGTNLLGVIKHLAYVELGYFGETFGRPSGIPSPWFGEDTVENVDMWATPKESQEEIVGLYRQAWVHADATIGVLGLDATGQVPWWGDGGEVTLHQVLVHVATETHRHAGHSDVVRELIDGSAGFASDDSNMPERDEAWWRTYREKVELDAREAGG